MLIRDFQMEKIILKLFKNVIMNFIDDIYVNYERNEKWTCKKKPVYFYPCLTSIRHSLNLFQVIFYEI